MIVISALCLARFSSISAFSNFPRLILFSPLDEIPRLSFEAQFPKWFNFPTTYVVKVGALL